VRYHWAIERSARPSRYGPEGFKNRDGLIWIYALLPEAELGYLGLLGGAVAHTSSKEGMFFL
jgi:hypothetical protein